MMAHAIDIACPDDGPTDRPRNPRAIGAWSGGCGPTCAGDSSARRRLQVRDDRRDDRLQLADHRVVETPLRERRSGGIDGPPPWLEADRADPSLGSPHHDVDAPAAPAWREVAMADQTDDATS